MTASKNLRYFSVVASKDTYPFPKLEGQLRTYTLHSYSIPVAAKEPYLEKKRQ